MKTKTGKTEMKKNLNNNRFQITVKSVRCDGG